MAGQYKWYLMLLFLLMLTLTLQISSKHHLLPITNHYIGDSYTYEIRVLFDYHLSTFANSFTAFNRILYSIGPGSFFIVNTLMLLASVYLCKLFECISPNSVPLARFVLVFNPYLLIGAVGPNKETVLIFISLLCFSLYFNKLNYIKVLSYFVALSAIFVRPIFGVVLVTTILLIPLIPLFKNPVRLFLSILSFYFFANSIPAINTLITSAQGEELPFFQKSNLIQIALVLQVMNQNPILQFPAFIAKTALILITPIFRPNSFYSMPFPILDLGYTFMAFTLFPFNLSLLLVFLKKKLTSITSVNKNTQILILYCFIGILTTIINSNITFRYIFPYAPFIVSLFYLHSVRLRNQILLFSMIIIVLTFTLTSIFFRRDFESYGDEEAPYFMSWF